MIFTIMSQVQQEPRKVVLSRIYFWSTISIFILVFISSMMGIFVNSTYARDTASWAAQARAQDVANLVGIGVLLSSVYFARRSSVRGLQTWAGALLFLIYGFVIYSFASNFNSLFLIYVATLSLLVYTFIGGVLRLNFERIRELAPTSPRIRFALGSILAILGFLFYFLWLSEDVPAIINGTVPASVTQAGLMVNPVHVLDMALYLPAMIMTGVSLLKNKTLGYMFGVPLLVFGVLTVLGIFLILLI